MTKLIGQSPVFNWKGTNFGASLNINKAIDSILKDPRRSNFCRIKMSKTKIIFLEIDKFIYYQIS